MKITFKKATQKLLCLLSLLLPCLAVSDAGADTQASRTITPRVINGNPAGEGEFPWMGYLYLDSFGPVDGLFCGATLIGPQVALTAAHCAELFTLSSPDIFASFGKNRLTSTTTGYATKVVGVSIHPLFDRFNLANDLALVHLADPVPGELVPLVQKDQSSLWAPGGDALVLGWGRTDPEFSVFPDLLQKGEVTLFSDSECEAKYGLGYKPQSMMCAGKLATSPTSGDGVDTCNGDSGGPLLVSDGMGGLRQVGLTSWGYTCGGPKFPGMYTRLAPFVPWINSNPEISPYTITPPTIQGELRMGETLDCVGADFGGSNLKKSFYWFTEFDILSYGPESTYTLTAKEVGEYVQCVAIAENSAGTAFGESLYVGPIGPAIAPTPLPTPIDTLDTKAPTSTFIGSLCHKTSCVLSLSVNDNKGPAAVTSVAVQAERVIKSTCTSNDGRTAPCTKSTIYNLKSTSLQTTLWQAKIGRGKKSYTYRLKARAIDASGNVQSSAARLTVRIPARRK